MNSYEVFSKQLLNTSHVQHRMSGIGVNENEYEDLGPALGSSQWTQTWDKSKCTAQRCWPIWVKRKILILNSPEHPHRWQWKVADSTPHILWPPPHQLKCYCCGLLPFSLTTFRVQYKALSPVWGSAPKHWGPNDLEGPFNTWLLRSMTWTLKLSRTQPGWTAATMIYKPSEGKAYVWQIHTHHAPVLDLLFEFCIALFLIFSIFLYSK